MTSSKKTIQYFLFLILIGLFLVGGKADAASVVFQSDQQSYGLQGEISVVLILDTQGESINAIEGTILYDADRLEFQRAEDDQSIISYWLERPSVITNGEISFSGLIPGGFSGLLSPYYSGDHPGKMITLFFKAKKSGQAEIKVGSITILKNDGKGTTVSVALTPITFSVSSTTGSIITNKEKDQTPPEEFKPEISRSPLLFDGKWFAVFSAEDRESGISHFEIEESDKPSPEGNWWIASSPYELKDQTLGSFIFIKAVDNANNEKIETIDPSSTLKRPSSLTIKIFLLLILLLLLVWSFRYYHEKKSAK